MGYVLETEDKLKESHVKQTIHEEEIALAAI